MFKLQALIRQLDFGKEQHIALDSLQESVTQTSGIPMRVGTDMVPCATYVFVI